MVLELCAAAALSVYVGLGLIIALIILAMLLFHMEKDTSWFKYPSLSILLVTVIVVVWQFIGCDILMWKQIIPLVFLEIYLLLALVHQNSEAP